MWTGAATGQERDMGTTLKFQISLKCVAAPDGAACVACVSHMGTRCHSFV